MLSYDLSNINGPIYKVLYEYIKADIVSGKLKAGEKIPSKRTFASNLGISTITIENSYDLLVSEGYIYSLPKKGYYVSDIAELAMLSRKYDADWQNDNEKRSYPGGKTDEMAAADYDSAFTRNGKFTEQVPQEDIFNFSSNQTESRNFPFATWAKLMREAISVREQDLMTVPESGGVYELRKAIADHLSSFRGMTVDPRQIIIGAGTEYLYGLLIQLLGNDKIYCIENPGYIKLKKIYESNKAICRYADMDESGIEISSLENSKADVAHVSPTHHFPTGISMPVGRRYQLLSWANSKSGRYIIEDDYDSEFRLNGIPIPPLYRIDENEKVIYMNTFSKSLASTIRISYMVLPMHLVGAFYKRLSFYSCTVSTFEQFTLSAFISQGYFEKHINRMRLHYRRIRKSVMDIIRSVFDNKQLNIIENDSGLHFILEFRTKVKDEDVKKELAREGIKISAVTDYDMSHNVKDMHQFIFNYSNMNPDELERALTVLKGVISK